MEKRRNSDRKVAAVTSAAVVFLGMVAFSCSVAGEFKRAKARDMKLDGNLCSLPKSSAFGLGMAAMACLSTAQIMGTSVAGRRLCSRDQKHTAGDRKPIEAIIFLALSWVSFGSAMVLLGAATSMNRGQRYGRGWLDGKCYVVNAGVYLGAAALVALTVFLVLGFTVAVANAKPQDPVHIKGGGMTSKSMSEEWVDAQPAM